MSILSWNVRGLGNLRTVRCLQRLLKDEVPDLVFLTETKLDSCAMEGFRTKFGFTGGFYVGRVGLPGGLAVY